LLARQDTSYSIKVFGKISLYVQDIEPDDVVSGTTSGHSEHRLFSVIFTRDICLKICLKNKLTLACAPKSWQQKDMTQIYFD
jgi:hypothetical protein